MSQEEIKELLETYKKISTLYNNEISRYEQGVKEIDLEYERSMSSKGIIDMVINDLEDLQGIEESE